MPGIELIPNTGIGASLIKSTIEVLEEVTLPRLKAESLSIPNSWNTRGDRFY